MAGLELITLVHPEIADEVGDILQYAYLPNIPGQKYTIGSTFPGESEGEEFLFYRYRKTSLVRPIHSQFTVDEKGRYLIKNAAKSAKVFINSERIFKPRLLKQGDIICFGISQTWDDYKGGPIFRVEFPDSTKNNSESRETRILKRNNPPFTPENNSLILSQILSFLSLKDVKNCRLLSKKWAIEGGKALEKRGHLYLSFSAFYLKPLETMKTFRLLNEPMGLKFRKLTLVTTELQSPDILGNRKKDEYQFYQHPLRTCKGEPGEKMLLDFQKFLTLANTKLAGVSSLKINGWIKGSIDFTLFHKILETFGRNLTELELKEEMDFMPDEISQLNFTNLKKLSHKILWTNTPEDMITCRKWISFIVPLVNEKLVTFSSNGIISSVYLETFLETGVPNLTEISLTHFPLENIVLLMKLNFLTTVDLSFKESDPRICPASGYPDFNHEFTKITEVSIFQDFLKKHAGNLKFLKVDLQVKTGIMGDIVFPRFLKLESFTFIYGKNVKPKWGFGAEDNGLKFEKFLPAIKKLQVCPRSHHKYNDTGKGFDVGKPLLDEGDEVWNSFFPEDGNEIVSTLVQLGIPALRKGGNTKARYDRYKKRLTNLPKMFPNVWNEQLREIRQLEVSIIGPQ